MVLKTNQSFLRNQLGFKEEALNAFSFLLKDYGFHLVKEETTFLRYENDKVFVNIYHGRASFELGFEIGLLPQSIMDSETKHSLLEIIELHNKQKDLDYTFFQASTKDRVVEYIPKLSHLVKLYAKDALLGDASVFKKLGEIQLNKSNKYIKEMELRRTRQAVEKAWNVNNYSKVITLYETIKNYMTSSERKKFDYAVKKVSKHKHL